MRVLLGQVKKDHTFQAPAFVQGLRGHSETVPSGESGAGCYETVVRSADRLWDTALTGSMAKSLGCVWLVFNPYSTGHGSKRWARQSR